MEELVASGDSENIYDVALDPNSTYRLTLNFYGALPGWAADAIVAALQAVGIAASTNGQLIHIAFST